MSTSTSLADSVRDLKRHHDYSNPGCETREGKPCDCGADEHASLVEVVAAEVERLEAQLAAARKIVAGLVEAARNTTEAPWHDDDGNVFSTPIFGARIEAIHRLIDGRSTDPAPSDYGFVATTEQSRPTSDGDTAFMCAARNSIGPLATVFGLEG